MLASDLADFLTSIAILMSDLVRPAHEEGSAPMDESESQNLVAKVAWTA